MSKALDIPHQIEDLVVRFELEGDIVVGGVGLYNTSRPEDPARSRPTTREPASGTPCKEPQENHSRLCSRSAKHRAEKRGHNRGRRRRRGLPPLNRRRASADPAVLPIGASCAEAMAFES